MILADENMHGFIIKALPDAGLEVVAVIEQEKYHR
jgi:hypothetical protein